MTQDQSLTAITASDDRAITDYWCQCERCRDGGSCPTVEERNNQPPNKETDMGASETVVVERIVGDGVDLTLCLTEPMTDEERGVLTRYLEHMANCCEPCRQDQDHENDHDFCTQPDDGACCCDRRP